MEIVDLKLPKRSDTQKKQRKIFPGFQIKVK